MSDLLTRMPATEFFSAEGYHQDYYKKNPVRYKFYKYTCGRAERLQELWGSSFPLGRPPAAMRGGPRWASAAQ
ncbi:MAG: peptide-methionine (S)-S-oxide reductase [Gammaproteobacteria bacterium]